MKMIERRVLSKEEQDIRTGLQELHNKVQQAIESVCTALTRLDSALCESIIANDKAINAQHNQIQQTCLTTIATQQPVAVDLRLLIAGLQISSELERIADYVSGIAANIINMANNEPLENIDDVLAMANAGKSMLQQAIQAYQANDHELAITVAGQDRKIDDMQTQISNDIIQQMCKNTSLVPFGTGMLWIVHSLERIGDRATNICEQIVYIKKGEILDLNC